MAIVWLASYPRSGNTWLRFLLQAYINAGDVDGMRLNTEIPDIHRKVPPIDPDASERLMVKTHFLWSPTAHPFADRTRGFIYILRHPKDVLLSFMNYRKLGGALPVGEPEMDRRYALLFCRGLGDAEWSRTFGSWPHHVASWLNKPALPHAVVRYENLLASPEQELRPVLNLLGLPLDEDRLRTAIESCRFAKLRKAEQEEKARRAAQPGSGGFFDGIPLLAQQGVMFMNKGESGQTLLHLGADVEEMFNKTFERYLKPLRYESTARPAPRSAQDMAAAMENTRRVRASC